LLTFSCKTRGFCPSCHAKRLEESGEWMRETLILDIPHRAAMIRKVYARKTKFLLSVLIPFLFSRIR
jgi:hypothetical protein